MKLKIKKKMDIKFVRDTGSFSIAFDEFKLDSI